jgi:NFU1 iron-sulfur cluster scaffold homolog, mitochondrial
MDTLVKKPVIIYAEATPNPASMKFVANRMLLESGATAQYLSKADTADAPLPAKLFELPFVKAVFLAANFVTVTKIDALEWTDVTFELRDFIRTYIEAGNPIVNKLPVTEMPVDSSFVEKKQVFTEHTSPTTDIEAKIIETLEEFIRPAVENDGGSITFTSFKDGIVTVQLRGSCSGCPSASFTLKAGIEQLLMKTIPEVKEVVAEQV